MDLNSGMPHALWIPGMVHVVRPLVTVEHQMTTANVRDAKTTAFIHLFFEESKYVLKFIQDKDISRQHIAFKKV